jgi:hypothetical protein
MRLPGASRRLLEGWAAFERRTRPSDPEVLTALDARWRELPDHVRTPAQLMGRRLTGCEGTHGVFPACNLACAPCYHSAEANRVRVDGAHTVAQVEVQMAYLRDRRGPGQHAQLIGGEVTLLGPEDHAAALEVMHAHDRVPMSFTHGDFDYDYLRRLAVRPDGTRRFQVLAFAGHFDTTMRGRRGAPQPRDERELHPFRARFCEMFSRLEREHGVRAHLAHNMTVTPANIGQVAEVVRACRGMGFRVFSFQPAAHVGNNRRWTHDFRTISDDEVWQQVERGVGTRLPHRALQMGDERCNRTTWGVWIGERYIPVLDDRDARDLRARDAFLAAAPRNLMFASRPVAAARIARTLAARPADLAVGLSWAARLVRRAGGLTALRRGVHPTTYVMHSFMDARDVAPAWELLRRGEIADDPVLRATQERLQACSYGMAHPETDQIVPACVQHGVLDPAENAHLARLLPKGRRTLPLVTDGGARPGSGPAS